MQAYCYQLALVQRLHDDAAWNESDNAIIDDHFSRIKEDFLNGKIIHVGRTLGAMHDGFGLVIFYAESLDKANQYALDDPAVKHGLMHVKTKAYTIIFDKGDYHG